MRFISLIIFLISTQLYGKEVSLKTPQGGSFAIHSTEGFLSTDQLIGKHVFLFFGFATCPDVCPLTLRKMKQLASSLTESERANFRFLFISVDNERDSIEKLKSLKNTYGSSFIGAVDSDEKLTEITELFGARYRRFKNKKNHLVIDHTDSIFHIDQQGKWVSTIPFGSSVESMQKELRVKTPAPMIIHPARSAQLLDQNLQCDLGVKSCSIKHGRDEFTLTLSPYPITTEKPFQVSVTSKSQNLKPVEVDFQGVALNMGFIRPPLTQVLKESRFETKKLTLPICELDRMEWTVRLIVSEKTGKLHYLDYRLITLE